MSKRIAANLLELALNIELVNPPDPSGRMAGTRDLTASLANLEQELAELPEANEPEEVDAEIERRAAAVARRAETLMDVAAAAADADDNASQPLAEAMTEFLASEPLLDTAGISKERAEETETVGPQGRGRQRRQSGNAKSGLKR